ncbi:MAG: hypothetical protein IKI37_10730, partial [Oscillospiraceae bacterium]|nr:hypothetical protein [Oscillospiraceae bacterium]
MAVPVHAEEHYDSYHYDKWKEAIPSQAGYSAQKTVSGQDLNTIDFSAPADLFIDKNQKLFIVDSGNNRIVITDSHLTKISKILTEFTYSDGKKTTLNQPQGIYISPETDFIYIADYQNSRVLVSDRNGHIQMEITKPDSVLFSQELTFLPQKVFGIMVMAAIFSTVRAAEPDTLGYSKFRFGGYGEVVANFKDYGINRFYGHKEVMPSRATMRSVSLVLCWHLTTSSLPNGF